ncbi:PREDICTED: cyclic AMP-responsive element-binding protein 1 isoform X5 [Nicrophorus vespilloides]|uniref:Cyclic AMP-responsive element-binding protein 1 isoform X5 n=1 Tax=Nicrophorus vespilloides TaxID=110193 RepID=A0ABM1MR85_NICVS|nr:PREDICTED: cyclic AMP-responsive element-binding protein 1 isoform X5 [Nicrophorus vespilloides]
MDGMVDENGTVDPLAPSPPPVAISSVGVVTQQQLVASTNIVHLTLPASNNHAQTQVQSVIQPNQQSVIQTAANIQPVLGKGNVILVSKPNSVIQTPQGSLHALQVVETTASDDSYSDDESPKKRRDLLTRRPSYRKILNDLGGGEIAVIPAGAIQISSGEGGQSIHTLSMTNSGTAGAAIVQYAQGQEFFVPVMAQSGNITSGGGEDQARKREMRLLKNREAARECRRKKKEYIKCLENRVAVLENQNKALIDELKSLKELYCKQKTE